MELNRETVRKLFEDDDEMGSKEVPANLHCPQCGLKLEKARWEAYNMDYRICRSQHLWEISNGLVKGMTFEAVSLSTCPCSEVMPTRYMRKIESRQMCPECFKKEVDAWRMDGQQSFAKLEITPVLTLEGNYYQLHTTVQIKPYPNPLSYGGMFGFGSAKTEDDLAKALQNFEDQVCQLKSKGLEKVEVIRLDQKTITSQPKMVQVEPEKPKAETKQLSLI